MQNDNLDPWSAMQARADAARTAAPPGPPPMLAYADGDSVGFDVRLRLPEVCVKCAATEGLQHLTHRLAIKADIVSRLALLADAEARSGAVLLPGDKVDLKLPVCATCQKAIRTAHRLRLAVFFMPLLVLAGAVAATQVPGALKAVVVLPPLIAWAVTGLLLLIMHGKTRLDIERVDSDGVIRIGGVHHDAAQAIVARATGQDAQASG